MDGVAAGDSDQAFELAILVDPDKCGSMAMKLYKSKVPPLSFAAYLDFAWTKNHITVSRAARSRAELARLFQYAQFDIPAALPEKVTCWRGTAGVSVAQARRGVSWSLSRDVAALFATRFGDSHSGPNRLLLKTTVPKSQILFYSDERQEKEVVLVRPPKIVVVDGDLDDWKRCAERHASDSRAAQTRLLNQLEPVLNPVDTVAHSVD